MGLFDLFRTSPQPDKPRLESRVTALENQVDDLDSRLDYLLGELKKVRGRQFRLEAKPAGGGEDPTPPPDPNQGDGHEPPVQPRAVLPTAHLARRFKQS